MLRNCHRTTIESLTSQTYFRNLLFMMMTLELIDILNNYYQSLIKKTITETIIQHAYGTHILWLQTNN